MHRFDIQRFKFISNFKIIENPPDALKPSVNQENTQITLKPTIPVYIPTPKHILESRKANGSNKTDEYPASKKPKLEYVPKAIKRFVDNFQ